MRTFRRKAALALSALALAGAGLVTAGQAATAAPAGQAGVTCGNAYWPHYDADGDHYGTVTKDQAAAHTGPYGGCTTVGYLGYGARVKYDCYVYNDYGNKWTWVRGYGWVYGAYLSGGGAWNSC
ncbi:hypothetical protein [Streptomyces abikoensis]|uniref:SH3 domain-containing protein n=1 Tax=Streptomyces abikoensis TaxID=97398 RepID=A0ABW7T204_9ACTN